MFCVCAQWTSASDSCDPMNCSPPDFSVHGISQARILEWVAISSSRGSSHPEIEPVNLTSRDQKLASAKAVYLS